MNAVLYRLSFIHHRLDDEIRRELRQDAPASFRLLRLKALRSAVKHRLTRQWGHALATVH